MKWLRKILGSDIWGREQWYGLAVVTFACLLGCGVVFWIYTLCRLAWAGIEWMSRN